MGNAAGSSEEAAAAEMRPPRPVDWDWQMGNASAETATTAAGGAAATGAKAERYRLSTRPRRSVEPYAVLLNERLHWHIHHTIAKKSLVVIVLCHGRPSGIFWLGRKASYALLFASPASFLVQWPDSTSANRDRPLLRWQLSTSQA